MASSETKKAGKISSLKDLQNIKERVLTDTALRADGYRVCITVHMGTCGIAAGARDIMNTLMEELASCGRRDIRLTTSGCIGVCVHEPVMTVEQFKSDPVIYARLDADKARLIFREHALGGKMVPQLALGLGKEQ